MEATPGMKRAVKEAVEILQNQGHSLVHFCPPGLDKVNELYGNFLAADSFQNTFEHLKHNPIDSSSLGFFTTLMSIPWHFRKFLSNFVELWSPSTAGLMTCMEKSGTTAEIWKLNALRLELIEAILREWERQEVDVVLAPGFVMPAPPVHYPGYQLATINYTSVYNLLNFTAGSLPVSFIVLTIEIYLTFIACQLSNKVLASENRYLWALLHTFSKEPSSK